MKVSMLDLVAEHAPYRTELLSAFERVLDSGRFVLGPEVEAFEHEIFEERSKMVRGKSRKRKRLDLYKHVESQ